MEIIILKTTEDFIKSFNRKTRNKIRKTMLQVKDGQGILREPYCKKISQNLYELRVLSTNNQKIRIFYTFKNNIVFFIHGFIKKTMKFQEKSSS